MTLCNTKLNTIYWNNTNTRPIVDSNLIVWLNPDYNMTTTWTDLSGNYNNATFTNTNIIPLHQSGTLGSCPEFLGSAYPSPNYSRGTIANNTLLNAISQELTLEAWVYPYIIPNNYNPIMTKANRYAMQWTANSLRPLFLFYGSSAAWTGLNANTSVSQNNWSHIMMTYNSNGGSNNMKIYINGILDAQTTSSDTIVPNPNALYLGAYSTWYYYGRIAEIRVYSRELSGVEVEYNRTHSATYYARQAIN